MSAVVSLVEYRRRHGAAAAVQGSGAPGAAAVHRLDAAVTRLDPLVRTRDARLTPTIQRELRAIALAVRAGRPRQAAERAERLVGILQHPAASG